MLLTSASFRIYASLEHLSFPFNALLSHDEHAVRLLVENSHRILARGPWGQNYALRSILASNHRAGEEIAAFSAVARRVEATDTDSV